MGKYLWWGGNTYLQTLHIFILLMFYFLPDLQYHKKAGLFYDAHLWVQNIFHYNTLVSVPENWNSQEQSNGFIFCLKFYSAISCRPGSSPRWTFSHDKVFHSSVFMAKIFLPSFWKQTPVHCIVQYIPECFNVLENLYSQQALPSEIPVHF